jgi:peptidoglycan/xylan/chitin deacetylase (PgdA/CDA1 family)
MQFKFFVISFLYKLFAFFNFKKNCHFRILMLHDIKRKNFKKLESNLKFLKKNYNFINPNQLNKNQFPKNKKNLLLTFDDGFKSNFIFANTVLKKLKIKAVFFVVADLINSNNYIKDRIIKNIYPERTTLKISKYNLMSWHDLRILEKTGHVIGSHTKSHLRLNKIKSLNILKEEIISPIYIFKKNRIKRPNFFAYSFGDFYSFNKKCFDIAKSKYEFIFSGIRGDNIKFNKILFRDNIEDCYNLEMINFFIKGYSDFLYEKFRKIFLSF